MNNKLININSIILRLNEIIKENNKQLVRENLFADQRPLHGDDMVLQLLFKSDSDIENIVKKIFV